MVACTDNELNLVQEHVPSLTASSDYDAIIQDVEEFSLPEELSSSTATIFPNVIGSSVNNTDFTHNHNEKALLGRVLFYDNRMSKNNSISCASCHKQQLAFSDDASLSFGFGGKQTIRNSMSITNPMLNSSFFWDSRSRSLEDLALRPVFDHVEMGMDSREELIAKISAESYYDELFEEAYGSDRITESRISEALAAFVSSMFSGDSKFDEGLDQNFENYSELEKHGMALFFNEKTQCASCHNGINFASPQGFSSSNPYRRTDGTTNIGLDLVYEDPGFADGKFKIPSLRNIALTSPYMHDGRFETLREVIDHYDHGIQAHEDLDPKLHNNGEPIRLNLTELDKDALEAFLVSLTSKSILTDDKFSNPFD